MAWITRQQAAEQLSVSVKTIDALIRRGQLPASRIGPKIVRINERDLEEYAKGRLVMPAPEKKKAAPPPRPCRYVPGMKVV